MTELEANRRLRVAEVMRLTGLSRTEVYRRANDGRLPEQIRESHKVAYWKACDLLPYLKNDQPKAASDIEALLA